METGRHVYGEALHAFLGLGCDGLATVNKCVKLADRWRRFAPGIGADADRLAHLLAPLAISNISAVSARISCDASPWGSLSSTD